MTLQPLTLATHHGSIPLTGEPFGLLAVAPAVAASGTVPAHYTGWWTVVHRPTGHTVTTGRYCLTHARQVGAYLAACGVNWGHDRQTLRADPAARAAGRYADNLALQCADRCRPRPDLLIVTARCPHCVCDLRECEADDTGEHCEIWSCPTCLHGCPDEACPVCPTYDKSGV